MSIFPWAYHTFVTTWNDLQTSSVFVGQQVLHFWTSVPEKLRSECHGQHSRENGRLMKLFSLSLIFHVINVMVRQKWCHIFVRYSKRSLGASTPSRCGHQYHDLTAARELHAALVSVYGWPRRGIDLPVASDRQLLSECDTHQEHPLTFL